MEDEENDATQRCLQNIFRDLMTDRKHVMPVWSFLGERKRRYALQEQVGTTAEMFEAAGSLGSIREKDCFVSWLAEKSDANADEILKVCAGNPSALEELLTRATGMSMHQKLPADLKVKEVMRRFLDERYLHMGRPLLKLKQSGGICNGDLHWGKAGAYAPMFSEAGELSRISFNGGTKVVDVPVGTGIGRT